MSRAMETAVADAVQSAHVPGLLLVMLDFASGAVRVNNSAVTIPWDGHEWIGLANVGAIDPVIEQSGLEMTGVSMSLTGIPSEMIARVLGEHYQGRACQIWFAPMNEDYIVLANPVLIFAGRMDSCSLSLGGTAEVTLSAESRYTDFERPRVRRYTHEDQIAEYPGDRFLEFVAQMVEKTLIWGRT